MFEEVLRDVKNFSRGGTEHLLGTCDIIKHMFYVYIITSEIKDLIYVGYTSDLVQRMKSHNKSNDNDFTKKFKPWKLVYYEAYLSEKDARNREKKLKYRGRAKALLKQRLQNSLHESQKVLSDSTRGIRSCKSRASSRGNT